MAEEEMQVSKGQKMREEEFNFIVPWGDAHLGDRNPDSQLLLLALLHTF